jgi:hypothetical protein
MKASTLIYIILAITALGLLTLKIFRGYIAYGMFYTPPIHLRDLDHFTEEVKASVDPASASVPVDHVYYYRERTLRGSTFIRFHYLNSSDFEKRRRNEIAELQHVEKNRQESDPWKSPMQHLESDSCAAPEMKSWWVQKDQPDCETYYSSPYNFIVLDKANHVVYIYDSGD